MVLGRFGAWARWLRLAAALLLIGLVALGPRLAWHLEASRKLDVVVVDKTVPFEKYREHAAVPWLLHTLKIEPRAGGFLDPTRDYVGYDPRARQGATLTDAHLARADALVVADTYGVYAGDYERPGDVAALERSPKLYGGLDEDEAAVIERFAGRGGLVVGEFNTFASPTEDAARARLERVFHLRWTRWVARYWPALEDPSEVPRWVGRVYTRVTGKAFDLTGPGLVFVRDDEDMVVLGAEDLGAEVVTQERTAAGDRLGLPPGGSFRYWMDVVANEGGEVLYEHVVDVTAVGRARLAQHGLAPRFPALVKHDDVYYFAGDFVDTAVDLGDPERAGLVPLRRRTGCGTGDGDAPPYFWSFYVPTLAAILEARAR